MKKQDIQYEIIYDIYETQLENKHIKNIYELQYIDIKNVRELIIKVDFKQIEEKKYKIIIKNFKRIIFRIMKKNNKLSNIKMYIFNYNSNNSKHIDFINAINAVMKLNKEKMYNYVYDTVYNSLEEYFSKNNVCDFHNNKCGEKINTSSNTGCCRHFKNKKWGILIPKSKMVVCEYLKDKKCSAKCISCKLFTCDYLRKKGIVFKLKDIFLIDTFFNPVQKYFIKVKVFTPKEEIIRLLLLWSF